MARSSFSPPRPAATSPARRCSWTAASRPGSCGPRSRRSSVPDTTAARRIPAARSAESRPAKRCSWRCRPPDTPRLQQTPPGTNVANPDQISGDRRRRRSRKSGSKVHDAAHGSRRCRRGAISDGTDHPTGAAADSPPMETLIQKSACAGRVRLAAPRIPSPSVVPPISTVRRTRSAFHPRRISASTSQPPINRSVDGCK